MRQTGVRASEAKRERDGETLRDGEADRLRE